jgi:hypothetical protein
MIGWLFSGSQEPGGKSFVAFIGEPVCAGVLARKLIRVAIISSCFHMS